MEGGNDLRHIRALVNMMIVTCICIFLALLTGCFGSASAPSQAGGRVVLSKNKAVIEQPVNSAEATTFSFSRNVVTNDGVITTNMTVQTVLGTHQDDTARNAWGEVQTVTSKLESANKLYYIGGFMMILGIGLAALKKFYNVGIKVVLGCEVLGIVLCLLPTAMTDTASKYAIIAMGGAMCYVVAKKFN